MMKKPKITKAIFPVAGISNRLWPATKSIPKEMLTIVDRPLIDYAVEEAKAAGIEQFIFITRNGNGKQAIQDYFDDYHFIYLNQPEPHGLGHAIWCANEIIGNEPFAVILPDDLFDCNIPCLKQLVEVYEEKHGQSSVISVTKKINKKHLKYYGVVEPGTVGDQLFKIRDIVEKPETGKEPSNLAVVGRYILQPEIFDYLEKQETEGDQNIELTDSIESMIDDGHSYWGLRFKGDRYDCGDTFGFIKANMCLAAKRSESMKQQIKQIVENGL